MQLKPSTLIWTFIWSLFMGVTAISIGVGAVFPPLNYIAAPVVCPGGQMSVNSTVYNPYPGTTVTTEDWICSDNRTGAQTTLSIFRISLVAGLVYGFLLFVVIVLFIWLVPKLRGLRSPASAEAGTADAFEAEHQADFQRAAATDDLEEQVLRELDRRQRSTAGSGSDATSGSTARRLREVESLRASNLITQSEYEKKRADILGSI